jgi:hypothetical protein
MGATTVARSLGKATRRWWHEDLEAPVASGGGDRCFGNEKKNENNEPKK